MVENYSVVTSDIVNLIITNSAKEISLGNEKRFSKHLTISQLKDRLELLTGANAKTMNLELYSNDNKYVCALNDDNAMLGSYPVENNFRIHVTDNNILNFDGGIGDGAEKFKLSDEEYSQKSDTVKAFLMKNKLGKYNQEEMLKKEEEKRKEMEEEKKLVETSIKVGSRCLVGIPKMPQRRGTVMYVGQMPNRSGYWVGVKYDEPLGKNDGSFEGKRYFECPDKYGGFVRPINVKCGDYPEEDFDLDEEI